MRTNGLTPLQSVLRNPTLVGAITVLIVILAVFLAYNANSGLPFVPTYRLTAEVPNAASLVPGNEVRVGGVRVGIVEDVVPIQDDNGSVHAGLVMKLDKNVDPLPVDSTVVIRARSALGLKYVELNRGESSEGFPEGGTIPVEQAQPTPVEFDEFLNTFDTETREGIRANLGEFGSALAGRGPDLNEAIGRLEPLLPRLERVTRNLASKETQLGRFFNALEQSAGAVAPIAETQAQMFVNLDVTLAAFAEIARPYLQETISRTPSTLATTSATLPTIRPFLENNTKLINDLAPGAKALSLYGPDIEEALRAGVPALRTSYLLNDELAPTAASLRGLADDSAAREGIDDLDRPRQRADPGRSLHRSGAERLQLRDAAVPKPDQSHRRGQQPRQLGPRDPARDAEWAQQRGQPGLGACERRQQRRAQLPALELLPEHRLARPERVRVRGRQRALCRRRAGDREPARRPGHPHRGPGQGTGGLMPRDPKKKVHKDFNEGIYHRPPTGPSFFAVGVLTAIILVILSYFAFVKELPFRSGYEVTATFENAATLRPTSPVRIAGVNVGEVTEIDLDGDVADVTFSVSEDALPLHADSQVTIRPRLFLEGNFFLDLQPGSPNAPVIDDDGAIPVTQTQTAVQLDEVLTTLQQPDRRNLSNLLKGFGSALADPPTAEEDIGMDPDVVGKSAAEALNQSFVYGAEAGKSSAQVSEAILGEQPDDLNRLINDTGIVFAKLSSREEELSSLITNFSITAGALAAESSSLQETLAELAPTLEQAEPSLAKFNEVLPPLRAFARELTPGVKELPDTIEAGNPWLSQTIRLLQPGELGGIASDLAKTQPDLSAGTANLKLLLPQLQSTSRCVTRVLDPTSEVVINDDFSTGAPNYRDLLYAAASQSGVGANFDGNGQMLRTQPGGGPVRVAAPVAGVTDDVNTPVWGYTIEAPHGSQPVRPDSDPPIRYDVNCAKNALPDLNGPAATPGAPMPAANP